MSLGASRGLWWPVSIGYIGAEAENGWASTTGGEKSPPWGRAVVLALQADPGMESPTFSKPRGRGASGLSQPLMYEEGFVNVNLSTHFPLRTCLPPEMHSHHPRTTHPTCFRAFVYGLVSAHTSDAEDNIQTAIRWMSEAQGDYSVKNRESVQ